MQAITRCCVLFLWIHSITFVKSQDCTLQQFIKGDLYDSNFDTTDLEASYPGGKQVRVSCNIGFSGFFKLICVEGKWQSRGTRCQPRSCGHPGDAAFADFHLDKGDDFVFGSQVLYTCQKGYQMISRSNHRRCMAGGWDGVVPVCEAQQCPAIAVSDNVQVIGDPEEATYGNIIRFSCKSATNILHGSQEIYCDEYGEWSGKAPTCEEIKCVSPVIDHGQVLEDVAEYKEHHLLRFECESGYRVTEGRSSKCTKLGIRAEWSPTPTCEIIKCALSLPPLEGTSFEPAHKGLFLPGDSVRVTCGENHWISDKRQTTALSTCKADGRWSIVPKCLVVTCVNRRASGMYWWDVSWNKQIRSGDTVRYSCATGFYKQEGPATCTREGWSPNPPCQVKTCNREDIPNTKIVNYQDKYFYNDRANYVCKDGYEGSFYRTCVDINEWNGVPKCREVPCTKPDISDADIISNDRESYSHNQRVWYACKKDNARRFPVVCERGAWTGIQSCTGCPKLEVSHGFVVGPYNESVYYTCEEGYKLMAKGWWAEAICDGDKWSGLKECIDKDRCGKLPVIPNGRVLSSYQNYEGGKRLQIHCDEGYSAQVDDLTCLDGQWHPNGSSLNGTICAPVSNLCSPPLKVKNALIGTSYQKEYLSGSEVTYLCRDGYDIQGEAKIRCNNGTWEKTSVKCTPPSLED